MSLVMELRREPFKTSQDSINNPESLLRSRRKSMSCTRLAPTPQMDISEIQKLATTASPMVESPVMKRVESPELDSRMNVLGMRKPNRSILKRKFFLPRSLRSRRSPKSNPRNKEAGSRFNPIKWLKKVRGESKVHGGSLKGTREKVVQVECNGACIQTPSFLSQHIYTTTH